MPRQLNDHVGESQYPRTLKSYPVGATVKASPPGSRLAINA
ncbi:hypothetical protein [uncultured Nostoc sp.]